MLVLASGRGTRFTASGGQGNKLQALLGSRTVLQHTLDAVQASGLAWYLEDSGQPGMGDSIAAAVRATGDATGWLILPGDLPLIQSDTLRAVAAALRQHAVVVPVYRGQRGHPVGFAPECGPALRALQGGAGGAPVVAAYGAFELPVDDIGCVTDIDTVAELQAAARLMPTNA